VAEAAMRKPQQLFQNGATVAEVVRDQGNLVIKVNMVTMATKANMEMG
jgi:hypothetical protein